MLLLRRQSKGFVRTSSKFRAITKDRVRCDGTANSLYAGWASIHFLAAATFCNIRLTLLNSAPQYSLRSQLLMRHSNLIMLSHSQARDPRNLSKSRRGVRMHVQQG